MIALIGGMAATVAVTPEFREPGGTDVIFDAPAFGGAGRALLLLVSAVGVGISISLLRGGGLNSRTSRVTIEVIAVSIGVGVLAGLGYRIVTARSVGANIGGGLVILASPIGALVFIGYLVVRLRAMRVSGHP